MNIANFLADVAVLLSMVTVCAAAFGTLANAKNFREAHPVKKTPKRWAHLVENRPLNFHELRPPKTSWRLPPRPHSLFSYLILSYLNPILSIRAKREDFKSCLGKLLIVSYPNPILSIRAKREEFFFLF